MSYNQILDNVLLRSIYFTTPANNVISSQYTLYGNGYGQAYFSNAVLPQNLSTLSTAIGATDSNVAVLSTQFSSLVVGVVSSISSLYAVTYATSTFAQDTSNYLAAQVAANFASTNELVTSTLEGFSTYSTFINQYVELSTTADQNFSTLSSYSRSQSVDALQSSYSLAMYSTAVYITSTTVSIDSNVSTMSSIYVPYTTLSTFSTTITSQLTSTSLGLTNTFTSSDVNLSSRIATLSTTTGNSLSTLISTTTGHGTELSSLEAASTALLSTVSTFVFPPLSTSQGVQTSSLLGGFSFYSSIIGGNTNELSTISSFTYSYAAGNAVAVSSINGNLSSVSSSLSTLWWEFQLLTTSSILSSIYYSFYNLELYTSSIISTTQGSYTQTLSSIEYSSYTQNVSVANSYFNYYVSTMYDSTLSTLIPSTIAFTSSLMSTLYSTGYALFESTIASTILSTLYSTNTAYLNTIEPGILSNLGSTLGTRQSFALSTNNTTAVMDMSTFQNFNIFLRAPQDPYLYRITYDGPSLATRDYQTGVITIDVSTIGVHYSTNSSALSLQTYHWGFPTYMEEQFIPYISNADYILQYKYTILNQTLYTSLLNVYPRTNLTNLRVSASGSNAVYRSGVLQSNAAWRGSLTTVTWTPYAWFPAGGPKGPVYQPQVIVDVLVNGSTFTSGPFPLQQSTGTVRMPSVPGGAAAISTVMRAYVAGRMSAAATTSNVGLLLPIVSSLLLSTTTSFTYIGGNVLQLYSDAQTAMLSAGSTSIHVRATSGQSNYNNTAPYAASNLFTPSPNTNFVGPRVGGADRDASALFGNLPAVAVSSIVYSTFTTGVSGIASSDQSARQLLVVTTATGYTRVLPLTSSTVTTFAL